MRKAISAALLASSVLSGCASSTPMRIAPVPSPLSTTAGPVAHDRSAQASADVWRDFAGKLPAGTLLKVRTSDGRRVTATLLTTDAESITVNPATRVAEPARRIRFEEIQEIDPVRSDSRQLAKAAAIGAGVGGATFLGLLMLLAASWD